MIINLFQAKKVALVQGPNMEIGKVYVAHQGGVRTELVVMKVQSCSNKLKIINLSTGVDLRDPYAFEYECVKAELNLLS